MTTERIRSTAATAVAIVGLVLALTATPAGAADLSGGQTGKVTFRSTNFATFAEALSGRPSQNPIDVQGTLTLPPGAGGRVPAMVIVHGSSGLGEGGREVYWSKVLLDMGVATFVPDSFAARGVAGTATEQIKVTAAMMTSDAFAALDLLATHPGLDADRIGIMGFDKGGNVAIDTAIELARWAFAEKGRKFALHVAFYPYCSISWRTPRTTGAPVHFVLAEFDNVAPIMLCQDYAERMANLSAGAVSTAIFPGVEHAFDSTWDVQSRSSIFNPSKCGWRIADDGVVEDVNSGFKVTNFETYMASINQCGYYGGKTGGNEAARAGATRTVAEYVKGALFGS